MISNRLITRLPIKNYTSIPIMKMNIINFGFKFRKYSKPVDNSFFIPVSPNEANKSTSEQNFNINLSLDASDKSSSAAVSAMMMPSLESISDKIKVEDEDNYKQLPEDSAFIEQHYDELKKFKEFLINTSNKKNVTYFKDFSSSELLEKLDKFIDNCIKPDHELLKQGKKSDKDMDGGERELEFFQKFKYNLKITLRMNGGHTFILDVLMQNKEAFDNFDKNKN
ncbi:hypothetical protein PACTADRAFT_49911 [Pachysolen tannophilus NRRL Y-2460]|uniref:Uncharacterized protein n=1 Tax=Pachysolen tannophilus NRRL Y-2460 TaxID=669874 RepID=A0A1E4TTU2_PACTA|nr:hypothetical protein PACTADRAFT_49911 [Pachysolen tannophilus NRRL Y-2460]